MDSQPTIKKISFLSTILYHNVVILSMINIKFIKYLHYFCKKNIDFWATIIYDIYGLQK